jgi:hypothetical protein
VCLCALRYRPARLTLSQRASELRNTAASEVDVFQNPSKQSTSETGFETPTIRSVRIRSLCETSRSLLFYFFVLRVPLQTNVMQSEQVVTLQIIIIPYCFASSTAPKYMYVGYESHLEVPAILVVDIYIDLVAYIQLTLGFKWAL